jgi:hypothetical protein
MGMPVSDANQVNTLVHWALGHRVSGRGGYTVTDDDATQAAQHLIGKAYKSLSAGLTPGQLRLSATATVRERLLQVTTDRELSPEETAAVATVLNVLDRIERDAATATARKENDGA